MRRLLSGVLFSFPLWSHAQQGTNALLWSVSGNGLPSSSYLYGTVHSRDERAFTYVDAVEEVMRTVNTVAGELDMDAARMNVTGLMGMMMMPGDRRLEDLYRKKDWAVVDAYLKAEMGVMAPMVQRMKPFFVIATLTGEAMGDARSRSLDDHLMSHAKANGHRTVGLESIAEQMNAMDALPLKEQAAMLLDHVERNGFREELDRLMDAYVDQDLEAIMAIMGTEGPMSKSMEKALLTDRNHVMAHRMDSVLRADGSALFLVGGGHLAGNTGVVQLLRGRGYTVEPVFLRARADPPRFPPPRMLDQGIHYTNDTLGFGIDMPSIPWPADEGEDEGWVIQGFLDPYMLNVSVSGAPIGEERWDLDAIIEKEVPVDGGHAVQERRVQGLEARLVLFEADGHVMRDLFVVRDGMVYMVVAMGRDATLADRVIDSFHFTGLPE